MQPVVQPVDTDDCCVDGAVLENDHQRCVDASLELLPWTRPEEPAAAASDVPPQPDALPAAASRSWERAAWLRERPGLAPPRVRAQPQLARGVVLLISGGTAVRCRRRVLAARCRAPAGATERLEELCRYAARPPVVNDRLSLTNNGRQGLHPCSPFPSRDQRAAHGTPHRRH